MYTVQQKDMRTKVGEPVQIVLTVTDRDGVAVDLDSGATGYTRIGRQRGQAGLAEFTNMVFDANVATVDFNTEDVEENDAQATGKFVIQSWIVKNGDALMVAEGTLYIDPVIDEPV